MPTVDRYATPLKLPMSIDTSWRFPHLPAYKTEYRDGQLELAYRPRLNMARLRVEPRDEWTPADVRIGLLDLNRSHDALSKLFVNAFARIAPLDVMPATTRRHAADAALKHTATGGDGKVFQPACFAAIDAKGSDMIGAAIITQIGLRRDEWPDDDLPETILNLTWLFVATERQRQHVGWALVDRVLRVLAEKNVPWLVSHFAEDNPAAMLFHWRQGFDLVSWMRK